ncbi:MAG: GNAT family N-acetyltransferase [Bacteroidetes bacterium CG02_land_8_20_14_3_00_31_25]|nr:MAG: GNAT family N-acetyltransferase [Bacteroidetes bacterium CG02_land_8_20_14_3_00_31_25]PIY03281.1 MAG: GNAT family N-acetyltransferase [Bacteroidetes bacterium CG_4_10_14_3_um_filter_31_20]
MNNNMNLVNKNICLRAVEPSDLDNLYLWENDTEVWKVSQTISPFSKFTLKEYCTVANIDLQTAKQLRLMIDVTESNKVTTVGMIDLFDYDAINKKAGIGILIGNINFRKKGIASLSIKLLEKYCFTLINLHQIYCFISEENKTSINLFLTNKFEVCGKINDWVLTGNKWQNALLLQKINKS